jgi:type VI secretion system secreted protein VgrG
MEEEGIVCRFDHQEDAQAEVLLLTDDTTTSRDAAQPVDFSGDRVSNDCIQNISRGSLVRPTKLAMRNFNWTAPSVVIEAEQGEAKSPLVETYHHDRLPPTLYDYTDGDGYQGNDANAQSQLRRELDASGELVLNGYGDVIGLSAGGRFELKEHVLAGEYLLTMVNHSFSIDDVTAYTTSFTCIPVSTPYRPQRRTPKPRVPGLETATVVGPSGQEIHADKHGRIKVQFHWDREGENDDHSSCFIRVVQPWAGAGWGFVFLPRIGMEVTVAFIQGDPDRPIITGTLYNGENLTPYEMPDEMTKSTIRTQSSPGGDGYNELSFEDKAGEEEVFLQAQRNLRELVKNDHGTRVENDQTLDVIGNQTTTIGEDEPRDATQTITVYGDKIEDVTGNFDETIIEGNFTQTVSKGDFDQTLDEGHFTQTISKGDFTHIVSEGGFSCTVGGEWKTEANKKVTLKSAEENVEVASAKKMDLKAGGDFKLKGDAKGEIELTDELKIKVGSASITITSSGDIELKGANIKINGDGEVTIKGSKTAIN